jgi:hypothetical protein
LRQIGVFETPRDEYGVVMYHHWRIEEESKDQHAEILFQ